MAKSYKEELQLKLTKVARPKRLVSNPWIIQEDFCPLILETLQEFYIEENTNIKKVLDNSVSIDDEDVQQSLNNIYDFSEVFSHFLNTHIVPVLLGSSSSTSEIESKFATIMDKPLALGSYTMLAQKATLLKTIDFVIDHYKLDKSYKKVLIEMLLPRS